MGRYFISLSLLISIMLFPFQNGTAQELKAPVNRAPAFAGSFYPAQKSALESQLQSLFSEAKPIKTQGKVQTLIVPHAGYEYSGIVAASGYLSIPADAQYDNIFIIASSHREQFSGASVYSVGNYLTPLGEAKVNRELALALIEGNKNFQYLAEAHDREHSIEVQIPYLQYHFKELPPIVPIVMGTSSLSAARDLAAALLPWFTSDNLFIISSDFSHYPSYKDAQKIDKITGDAILTKDPEIFYEALRSNSKQSMANLSTPSCGWSSIMSMLYMAKRIPNMELSPVLYRNSGDSKIGDKNRVVGYWAIAGSETPPQEQVFGLSEVEKQSLLHISRSTLESFIKTGELPQIDPGILTSTLIEPVGAFVTLHMGGRLRGCIGNFTPSEPLYAVVMEMTLAAAVNDGRFAPVEEPELKYIDLEISVLTPLREISSIDEFELGKHGIYIIKDAKSGTFLPQVAEETGWNKEEFLGHCSRDKAGLGWEGWKEADLYIYEAIIFGEKGKE